jgi:hypothetical protein
VTALFILGDEGAAYNEHFLAKTLPRAASRLSSSASCASGFDPAVNLESMPVARPDCRFYAVDNDFVRAAQASTINDPIRSFWEFECSAALGREGSRRLSNVFGNAQAPRLCCRN